MSKTTQALSSIRVLDFSHVYQGPVATQILADFGADVIKIERPGSGDWSRRWGPYVRQVSLPFANLNRNKRSITVDLKSDKGMEIVLKLIASADVLVHNFRNGVMEKLGLGYAALNEINPRLIYASSSGWGDKGLNVERGRAGHDLMARAEGGWFDFADDGTAPSYSGISMDYPAGLFLVQGILLALYAREQSGLGQLVSTDLLSVAFHAHSWDAANTLNQSQIDDKSGIGATESAINHAFKTQDGFIEVSPVFSSNALRNISTAMGLGDLSLDSRFIKEEDQIQNKDALNDILAKGFIENTTEAWITQLESKGVLCARIKTLTETSEDPQISVNEMILDVQHPQSGSLRLQGTPLRLHDTPAQQRLSPPLLGEHNQQVLAELGYSPQEIQEMINAKVLG